MADFGELDRPRNQPIPWPGSNLPSRGREGRVDRPPTYPAGDVPTVPDMAGRERAWEMLNPVVRQKMEARAGEVLEWWAHQWSAEQIYGVVLGSHALCEATPIVSAAGRRQHEITYLPLDPASFRFEEIHDRTPPAGAGGGGTGAAGAAATGRESGFSQEFRDFLGHLPHRAQVLLQEPFGGGEKPRSFWYYEDSDNLVNSGWSIWCYITDGRKVTFASGTRSQPRGYAGSPFTWRLICRIAHVARRH
ncbi:hypothetical protein [Streptosporangium sp. NPDC002721]|uniref:hypothetical protein n=1 Tax=Streptosporangium sp. NPDC002721 TaxID=3366188 RepID=UPI00368B5860